MHAGDKVKHVTKPGEPFARPDQRGLVDRLTPAYRQIPAMAYVVWDDGDKGFQTWERLTDLVKL